MLYKLTLLTSFVFIGCALWLGSIWQEGNKTAHWVEVQSPMAASNHLAGAQVPQFGNPPPQDGVKQEWQTVVEFEIDGATRTATVNEYLTNSGFRLFVNPDDPTQAVTQKGHSLEEMQLPLIGTAASAVVGLLLLVMTFFSRKEKHITA